MVKFRFSNISTGKILFVSILIIPGFFALFSGMNSLYSLERPVLIQARLDTCFLEKETVGMFRNAMIDYQIGILKTKEYPCSFNLGEIKDSIIIESLILEKYFSLYIKQKDSSSLMTSRKIEVLGLDVVGKQLISYERTILRKRRTIDMRIQLGLLAVCVSSFILIISGFRKEDF